jgi:hypothetical protein
MRIDINFAYFQFFIAINIKKNGFLKGTIYFRIRQFHTQPTDEVQEPYFIS